MTHLRKLMLEDLQRRNYSEDTIRATSAPSKILLDDSTVPQTAWVPNTFVNIKPNCFKKEVVIGHSCHPSGGSAILLHQDAKKGWSVADTPYPKRNHRLPAILSQEEVAQLIDAACTPFHRTMLMTLYATGARCAELTHLKLSDVDNKRMVIHIQGGKERKDRDVMLSPVLLEELRAHWRRLRRKPSNWLFPGNHRHSSDQPIDTKTVWHACITPPREPTSRKASIRTRCGIVLPRTCSKQVPICAPFRSC